ncbi:flippase [Halosimplex sp. TS25]|uniref:flippase n=1 Tax=Halosimplex rarum TaxID=3396619 RepID=UPI0039E9154C
MDRSILSGFLSIASAKAISLVMGILTTPVLYQLLGPRRVGIFGTVVSVQALFMIFVSAGVTDGVRKYVAEDRDRDRWEGAVVGFYFRLALLLAAAGALLMFSATHFGLVATVFGPAYEPLFYLLVVGVFAAQFWGYARRTLMGFGLERYSEPLKVFNHGLFVGLALPLVALGFGAAGALAGRVFSGLVAAVVGLAIIARKVSLRGATASPDWLPRREMLTFNSLTVLLMFLMMSLYHVDVVMLQVLVGGATVGYYKGALTLAEFLWMVPLMIQSVFVHSMSELWSNDRVDRINEIAARTTRYTLLLTALMGLGLVALADVAVPTYLGSEYSPAVTPLVLLIPGAVGFALARPLLAIEQGKGDLRYPIAATGASAVVNALLNLALIPRFGMRGAAVATSVGYASMFVFHLWSAHRIGFQPLADLRVGRVVATVALAAGPILALPRFVTAHLVVPVVGVSLPLSLFVVPPAGLVVFLTTAYLTGAVGVGETVDILTSCPDPLGTVGRRLRRRFPERTAS